MINDLHQKLLAFEEQSLPKAQQEEVKEFLRLASLACISEYEANVVRSVMTEDGPIEQNIREWRTSAIGSAPGFSVEEHKELVKRYHCQLILDAAKKDLGYEQLRDWGVDPDNGPCRTEGEWDFDKAKKASRKPTG